MFKLFLLASIYIFALGKNDKVQIATIQFKVIQNGDSDRRYIWLHGDEQTARMALESHMKKNQGKAFLVEGILRESEFYGGIIDPNRIFSSDGAQANIQKYNPGGHFAKVHSERVHITSLHRLFAFMTYLNDDFEGGKTSFIHHNIDIEPIIGKTLIWPAEWTHAHKGNIVKSGTKYIATGWIHLPIPSKLSSKTS